MGVYVDTALAQFENENALRTYPFSEGSSLEDKDGKELSRDAIVDLHVVVPFSNDEPNDVVSGDYDVLPKVALTSFHVSNHMVSACFSCGSAAVSVTVSKDRFRPYTPYVLEKLAGSEDIGGIVTFGDMEFPGFPETYFFRDRFDGDVGVVVHPCCVAAIKPPGLRSFVDARSGDRISGDVNIDFSGYVKSDKEGKSFRLSLEEGANVELASECSKVSGAEVCGATPIVSINGVRPDDDGNIVLWFH